MSKVLVALSGGVDSTVAALLLARGSYDVSAVVMRMSPLHEAAVSAAEQAARQLEIPLTVCDCQAEFSQIIINNFVSEYAAGRTPNPCVICNPQVKFAALMRTAAQTGCDYIATGHYARVDEKSGLIARAACLARDQSYMLYRLNAEVRGKLLLPLGEVADKAEVREIALNAGFACHNAPDSTENCFLPDSDYAAFLREKLGELPGDIISPQGEPAGRHTGVYNFTVGQRKGLGSFGKPVFVRGIDAASRRVYLGYGEDEFCSYALLENCVWHADSAGEVEVKIRSMAKPAAARVTPTEDGAHIDFDAPQRAVTPGQSAVIYRSGQVVGGGIIC